MFELHERRKIRRILYSWGMVAFLLVILGLTLHGTLGVYKKYKEGKANLETATRQYEETKKRADFLEREAARLGTDRGIESEIRNRFQVAKPGEQLVLIVDENPKKSVGNETPLTAPAPWWQFWKYFK